jgi:hypothetical protein
MGKREGAQARRVGKPSSTAGSIGYWTEQPSLGTEKFLPTMFPPDPHPSLRFPRESPMLRPLQLLAPCFLTWADSSLCPSLIWSAHTGLKSLQIPILAMTWKKKNHLSCDEEGTQKHENLFDIKKN